MTESIRPEFDILDSEGLEYHRWVSDVETTFLGKDFLSTIVPSSDPNDQPSVKVQANALMFLRRHIDPSLRWEYLHLKSPKELWDSLKGRFGNIHNTLLPELQVQWNNIRLLDYKRVNDFNKDMLQLKARLIFCDKVITEEEMLQKTLSTFPTSALILANQYRMEVDNKRITTYNKLINLLQVAERHDHILLNNNARPAGTKKVPEANYGTETSGKNPKVRGRGRADHNPRGRFAPRGRGHGGRSTGRGRGRHYTWHRDGPNAHAKNGNNTPKNYEQKRDRSGNEPCYRCGGANHWYKECPASERVAAAYKKYKESKEQETHYTEDGIDDTEVHLTVADFQKDKEPLQSMDVLDFD